MQSSTPSLFAVCYRCRPSLSRVHSLFTLCRFSTPKNASTSPSTPKDIIILDVPRSHKSRHRNHRPITNNTVDSEVDSLDIDDVSRIILTYEREAQMDATRSDISQLKPPTSRVSQQRYQQLYDCLFQSFNLPQLTSYYRVYRTERRPLANNNSKANIVHQILKKIWGIEIAEEIAEREDLVIVKEIKSNKRDIYFLISDDGKVLRSWANTLSARITVNVAESVLQVHASQVGIERIETNMRDLLSQIISEDFDLSAISRIDKFNEAFIIPVSRTTKTFVERLDDNTLRIFALGPKREQLDDARRLLFTSVNMEFRYQSTLMYEMSESRTPGSGALFPISEDSSLPWMFRDREWSRWKELTSEYSDHNNQLSIPSATKILGTLHGRNESSLDSQAVLGNQNDLLDKPQLSTTYAAVLGHLLHLSQTDDKLITINNLVAAKRRRVLCNTFPGSSLFPRYLNSTTPFGMPVGPPMYQESFRLRFLPSPWSNPQNFEKYPPVYITMRIDPETGHPYNPRLAALQSKVCADMMLPGQHADIRFLRKDMNLMKIASVLGPEGGVSTTEWDQFMSKSNLNPIKDYNLRASPTLDICIPNWMIQGDIHSLKNTTYNFAGMEYRRTISVERDEIVISRAAIEGGASGGRKTEFSLSYNEPLGPSLDSSVSMARFHSLVEKATDCVASLGTWMQEVISTSKK